MRPVLRALLEGVIDYAGLFPPAKLPLEEALAAFQSLGDESRWMVDRFVCPSNKLADANLWLRESGDRNKPIPVTVVGTAIEQGHGAAESFRRDLGRIDSVDLLEPVAYEVKLPLGHDLHDLRGSLRALVKSGMVDAFEHIYLEIPWTKDLEDVMHEVAADVEGVGFKGRTGGTEAAAFPGVESVAEFIYHAASLECPFKFTAGLHEPLRYEDTDLGVMRQGFMNVALASALALTQDLNRREIEEILSLTDPTAITIHDDAIDVTDFSLTGEDVDTFWQSFGGFGSCSVQEPVDGLKRLGYWNA